MVKVTDGSGGQYWHPADDGMLILEFLGYEETEQKKFQSQETEPAWRWNFKVYDFATRQPILDDDGEEVVYADRTSQSLNLRSNAYARMTALLKRDPAVGETEEDLFAEAIGCKVFGNFKKGWLKTMAQTPRGF